MFSFTLAAFELFGVDALVAARLLNALAFGVNILLVSMIAKRATKTI
jgi:hypothetical protein